MMQAKREMEGRSRMRIRSRADRLQRIRRISAVQDARKAEEKPDGMDGAPSRPRPTSENGVVLDSRGRQIGFRDWENASEEWDWSFAKKKPDLSDHKELEVDNSEYENYLKRRKKVAMKRHRARGPDKEAIPKYTGKGEVLQGFFKL